MVEGETLVIFDEVQECPKALTSLKYFRENAPGLHIAAAGSLLGLTVHQGTGFPVGSVNMLDLFPPTFGEFLDDGQRDARARSTAETGGAFMPSPPG